MTRSGAIATPSSGSAVPPGRRGRNRRPIKRALLEETFQAGQQAWTTSAASALAKMTARIGAGDTDLGRRIRQVQDLSERILRLNADDQQGADRLERGAKGRAGLDRRERRVPGRKRRQRQGPGATITAARRWRGSSRTRCSAVLRDRRRPAARRAKRDRAAIGQGARRAVERRTVARAPATSWPSTRRMEAAEKALSGYGRYHGPPHRVAQRHRPLRDARCEERTRPDRQGLSSLCRALRPRSRWRLAETQALLQGR